MKWLLSGGLFLGWLCVSCAQAPHGEIEMVRTRIESTVREYHTENYAPRLTSDAREQFALAEAGMLDQNYDIAIARAANAARLVDAAATMAQAQRARAVRRLSRLIRDNQLHWAMLAQRRPELTGTADYVALGESLRQLVARIEAGEATIALSDDAWNLKRRLVALEALH